MKQIKSLCLKKNKISFDDGGLYDGGLLVLFLREFEIASVSYCGKTCQIHAYEYPNKRTGIVVEVLSDPDIDLAHANDRDHVIYFLLYTYLKV